MAMLTLAAVLLLLLGFGGGVSGGGVSGGGVRSSSELSIGLIARGNEVAFGGSTMVLGDCIMAFGDCIMALGVCTIAFGGLGGSSSMSESLSCSAGLRVIFAGLVCSNW